MAVADHDKISPPAEAEDFPLCFDQVNVCRGGTQADGGGLEQVPGGGREAPVAIAPLVFQLVESGEGFRLGQSTVGGDALLRLGDIIGRDPGG